MQTKIFHWMRAMCWAWGLARWGIHVCVFGLGLVLLLPGRSLAQSFVQGKVIDSVTGTPIVGVKLSVKQGAETLGEYSTNGDGEYQIAIQRLRDATLSTLTLFVHSETYIASSMNIQIKSGVPTQSGYEIALLPNGLGGCLGHSKHKVVVGHFRSPLGRSYGELPGRIADVLHFNLLTRLQEVYLPPELQPVFEPCEQASPRAVMYGKNLARALRAHAFLSGSVKEGETGYDVSTYVSDAYDLFHAPEVSTNRSVDLDDPSGAEMDPKTHAAVLAAVAAGLEKSGDCTASVLVTVAAERILGEMTPPIATIRERCQQQLPHIGLLSRKSP